jgi:oligopeptide transport system permease protein
MDMNIDKSLFQTLKKDEKNLNVISRPSETYWQDARRRLKQNKVAVFAFYLLIALLVIAIVGPFISKYDYAGMDLANTNSGPTVAHWFGTDSLGRDLLVRNLWGARISLSVGIVSAVINFVIGVIYGGISGYYGGYVDVIMMRIVEIIWVVPPVLFVILLMVMMGAGLINIYIALGISFWVGMARIVRGQVLSLKEQEFILAAKALGAKDSRIILRHLVPNCMGPIIVMVTMSIPSAIFYEAFLSYIGLGVSAPMASLGVLCSDATDALQVYPYQLFFPAMCITLIMLAFNLFGDGLRDALDPKMRK